MVSLVESIVIDQPPDDVYAFLADFENERRWRTEVERIDRVDATHYRQTIRPLLRRHSSVFEVTGGQPGAWLAFRDDGRPSAVKGLYTLEPVGAGTRVTLTTVLEPRPLALRLLGRRLGGVLHRRIGFDLRRLKALLEGSAAPAH